jgi:O-antigen/teichoic acid export membrane protein
MRKWLVVAICVLVVTAAGMAVGQQISSSRQQAAARPQLLRVLTFSTPEEGEPSIFLQRLRADPRSLEVTAIGPEAWETLDLAAYDLFVVDNYLPPIPVVKQTLDAVRQGKGLLFRASLDYGPVTEGDAGRLEALEAALPVRLARDGFQTETVTPRPGTVLIPIGVDSRTSQNPLVREIGWRSAPSVPAVARTPLRDAAAQVLVRELRTAERNPVLALGRYGQGQILTLSLPVEGTVNEYLRNWPYFKYLLYLGLRTLGHASYEPYGTWVGSPETLTPAVRSVLLVVLGGLVLVTLLWIVWARRRSRREPLTLRPLPSLDAAQEDGARLGMWERAGFHKALSGHMFYLTVNLVTSVFVILTMLYFLPSFITPDPSVMGLDYLAASLFSLVFALADFGSFSALGRFLGEHHVKDPGRTVKYVQILIYFQLITGLLQTTLIWLFAIYALPVTRQFSFLAWSFVLKGLIQWPGMLWVFKDTLNGLQKYDYAVWIVTGNYVLEWITWVGCIALFRALFGDVLTDPIASQLGASVGAYVDDIVTTFFSLYLLGRVQKAWRTSDCFRMDFDRAQLRETLVFGGKVLAAGLSVLAVNMAVTLLQLNTVYNYLYVAAFVGLAAQTRLQVPQQGQIILDNLYAPIAEAFNNGKRALSTYYVSQGLKWFATSTVPLYLVSVVLLPPLLRDILPPVYQDVAWMVLVLTVVMPLLPLDLLMKTVLLGADRAGVFSWATLGEQMLRLAVYAALLPIVGPAAQMWVLLLGNSPAKLLKVAGLWTWIHRRLLPIRVHVYQTLVAPLLAGAGYLGLCALLMLLVRQASLVGQIALSLLDVGLVAVLGALVARRRFAARPALMQRRAFGLGLLGAVLAALLVLVWMGDEMYFVSLIMTLVVFLPPVAYFPLLGLLGGWDRHGLEQFALAADQAGLAYALYYPAHRLSAALCRVSPLFDRYPIPHAEAEAEAAELDRLRLERTYAAPPAAPADGAWTPRH